MPIRLTDSISSILTTQCHRFAVRTPDAVRKEFMREFVESELVATIPVAQELYMMERLTTGKLAIKDKKLLYRREAEFNHRVVVGEPPTMEKRIQYLCEIVGKHTQPQNTSREAFRSLLGNRFRTILGNQKEIIIDLLLRKAFDENPPTNSDIETIVHLINEDSSCHANPDWQATLASDPAAVMKETTERALIKGDVARHNNQGVNLDGLERCNPAYLPTFLLKLDLNRRAHQGKLTSNDLALLRNSEMQERHRLEVIAQLQSLGSSLSGDALKELSTFCERSLPVTQCGVNQLTFTQLPGHAVVEKGLGDRLSTVSPSGNAIAHQVVGESRLAPSGESLPALFFNTNCADANPRQSTLDILLQGARHVYKE